MSLSSSQQVYEMIIKFPGNEKESIILPPWIAAAAVTWDYRRKREEGGGRGNRKGRRSGDRGWIGRIIWWAIYTPSVSGTMVDFGSTKNLRVYLSSPSVTHLLYLLRYLVYHVPVYSLIINIYSFPSRETASESKWKGTSNTFFHAVQLHPIRPEYWNSQISGTWDPNSTHKTTEKDTGPEFESIENIAHPLKTGWIHKSTTPTAWNSRRLIKKPRYTHMCAWS